MKIVQDVGSTREEQDVYVGPARQITLDTDNWDIRLHDGVTVGGHRILNRDNADNRYQARLAELDGFGGFAPELKGLWVRTAAGTMVLRVIAGNPDNITVTNGNGVAGNPTVGLAATINTQHTWEAEQTFDTITVGSATGLFLGNTTGMHFGDVVGNLDGDSTGTHTGNVDVSAHTLTLADDQIPQAKVAGLTEALAALLFPSGAIIMFGGLLEDIPDGWSLCDGSNGTPDLRSKFVMGTYEDEQVGLTGGAESHTHGFNMTSAGAHVHGITVDGTALTTSQMPAHFHGSGVCDQGTITWANHGQIAASPTSTNSVANDSNTGTAETKTTTEGGGAAHSHTASSASNGAHTHVGTIDSTSIVPPYMKLFYIMKD